MIENQNGLAFSIDDIQFRETMPVYSKYDFIKNFLVLLLGFFLLTGIIYNCMKNKQKKISWYAPIHGLQTLFLYVGSAGESFASRFSERKRRLLRRGLFCFLLLFSQVNFVLRYYFENDLYRYIVLVCVIVLLLIGFLCWEKPLEYLNWKNKLVASWMGLWILSMISDFMVDKQYGYMGYIMIFCFSFLYFMLGNMKHREDLLLDLIRGIEWSFVANIVFCYIFRPYLPGYRYLGGATKPGFFGMYLLFVIVAFLADLRLDDRKQRSGCRNVVMCLALGAAIDLIWKTQTISALIPMVAVLLLFSFKWWIRRKKVKIWSFVFCVLAIGIGWMVNNYSIYHIPRALNTEIKFVDDFYLDSVEEHPFVVDVRAAEPGNENRLLYKLKKSASVEELLSGRTLYWKAHIRDLNLWGHEKRARFWGSRRFPHNGVIAMMHRYGIFAAVPYILLVIYFIGYSYRYFKRHLWENKYAFFVLANMIGCMALMLVENQELPFSWIFWYSMYIVIGVLFDDERAIKSK